MSGTLFGLPWGASTLRIDPVTGRPLPTTATGPTPVGAPLQAIAPPGVTPPADAAKTGVTPTYGPDVPAPTVAPNLRDLLPQIPADAMSGFQTSTPALPPAKPLGPTNNPYLTGGVQNGAKPPDEVVQAQDAPLPVAQAVTAQTPPTFGPTQPGPAASNLPPAIATGGVDRDRPIGWSGASTPVDPTPPGGMNAFQAVHQLESSGRMEPGIRNTAGGGQGAAGPMQVRSGALADYNKANGTNYTMDQLAAQPEIGKKVGDWYLQTQYDTFGRWDYAMGAYHDGPGAMRNAIATGKGLDGLSDDGRNYVRNGMRLIGQPVPSSGPGGIATPDPVSSSPASGSTSGASPVPSRDEITALLAQLPQGDAPAPVHRMPARGLWGLAAGLLSGQGRNFGESLGAGIEGMIKANDAEAEADKTDTTNKQNYQNKQFDRALSRATLLNTVRNQQETQQYQRERNAVLDKRADAAIARSEARANSQAYAPNVGTTWIGPNRESYLEVQIRTPTGVQRQFQDAAGNIVPLPAGSVPMNVDATFARDRAAGSAEGAGTTKAGLDIENDIRAAGDNARASLGNIQAIRAAGGIRAAGPDLLSRSARAFSDLTGLSLTDVSNNQLNLTSTQMQNLGMSMRAGMMKGQGAVSDFEGRMIERAVPSLNNTPDALDKMFQLQEVKDRRAVAEQEAWTSMDPATRQRLLREGGVDRWRQQTREALQQSIPLPSWVTGASNGMQSAPGVDVRFRLK